VSLNVVNPFKVGTGLPVGGWVELGRTTLGSPSDTIDVGSLPDKRYYMILSDCLNSGSIGLAQRFGNSTIDVSNNYARRQSVNGTADSTSVNRASIDSSLDGAVNFFMVSYIANLSNREKLIQTWFTEAGAPGAGTSPERCESAGKWVNTTNPIDIIETLNDQAGTFATGSEQVVLGWDPTDVHTNNFWEQLVSVDLSGGAADVLDTGIFAVKKYLWIQYYAKAVGSTTSARITFNGNVGNNYARRVSANGAADTAAGNLTNIDIFNDDMPAGTGGSLNMFMINGTSDERLGVGHTNQDTVIGAGTTPDRREGAIKWFNASPINQITLTNNKAGTLDTPTILKVWGSD